jgi:hypothetical protein
MLEVRTVMKRLIWLPVAGFLLVAGAAVAAAAPGLADSAAGLLDEFGAGPGASSSPSPDSSDGANESDDATEDFDRGPRGFVQFEIGAHSLLSDVLANLVSTGVITQDQADAITAALTQVVDDRHAEMEAKRQQMQEMWTEIRSFLEDGVITAEEIAQLPDDNPFSNLEDILADGQVTLEELRSVAPFGGPAFGPGGFDGPGWHGHGRGPGGSWMVPAPDGSGEMDESASPNSGAGSDAANS